MLAHWVFFVFQYKQEPRETGILSFVSQMGKLRHREVKPRASHEQLSSLAVPGRMKEKEFF